MKMIIEVRSPTRNEIDNVSEDEVLKARAIAAVTWVERLIADERGLLAALKNLVERKLIKDTDGDHYDEVLDAIAKAEDRA